MSKETNISWCDHTASPWLICTEVDECCANCYARVLTERHHARTIREAYRKAGFADWQTKPLWGKNATRVLTKGFWKDALGWNRNAAKQGTQPKMFTSLMDPWDDMPAGIIDQDGLFLEVSEVRARFLRLVFDTPNLLWLLLTKRPENWLGAVRDAADFLSSQGDKDLSDKLKGWAAGDYCPENIWFGYTAGTWTQWVGRHEISWNIPAVVHWCSAEPLLEYLYFHDILRDHEAASSHNLDWIVIGGESGPKRRDVGALAIEALARDAQDHGCKVFVKQDVALMPGMKGRITDEIWAMKEFPI